MYHTTHTTQYGNKYTAYEWNNIKQSNALKDKHVKESETLRKGMLVHLEKQLRSFMTNEQGIQMILRVFKSANPYAYNHFVASNGDKIASQILEKLNDLNKRWEGKIDELTKKQETEEQELLNSQQVC